MNTGIISSRYAHTLLLFSEDKGDTESVLTEAMTLDGVFAAVPRLSQVLQDGSVDKRKKMDLLKTAAGGHLSDTMERFLDLVLHNGREGDLRFILHSYQLQYYKSRKITFATLTTAVQAPPELQDRIRAKAEELFGGTFVLREEIDPSIIGGLVLSVDDFRLDASVATRLKMLRKEFNEQNNRIV